MSRPAAAPACGAGARRCPSGRASCSWPRPASRSRSLRSASDADAAVAAAAALGGRVALKLDAVGLAHKSDVGGVRLGLAGDDAVRSAAEDLLAIGERLAARWRRDIRGLLVEPMAEPGLELIVGLTRDPQFGPVVLVGSAESLPRSSTTSCSGLAPVDLDEAASMLDRLRGARLLDGVRGRPAVDRDGLAAIVVAVGRLGVERPDIRDDRPQSGRSPGRDGAIAVDALVVLEPDDAATRRSSSASRRPGASG